MEKGHSEEFFGGYRDFWWNQDFLELMAKRWHLDGCTSVLDVGCGLGHWSEQLFRILPEGAIVTGVDSDNKWVTEAPRRMRAIGFAERFQIQQGTAESLPFADRSFDMVTCQTVLIHVKNVPNAIKEMKRVLKPGGLLALIEPNNICLSLTFDSESYTDPIEDVLDSARFHLSCERGKTALGRGNSSAGDLLPGLVSAEGFEAIQVYLSDKALPLFPPYSSAEQKALVQQLHDWHESNVVHEEKSLSLASYLKAGGQRDDFERYWKKANASMIKTQKAISELSYHRAGGALMYLVSGRKPR